MTSSGSRNSGFLLPLTALICPDLPFSPILAEEMYSVYSGRKWAILGKSGHTGKEKRIDQDFVYLPREYLPFTCGRDGYASADSGHEGTVSD